MHRMTKQDLDREMATINARKAAPDNASTEALLSWRPDASITEAFVKDRFAPKTATSTAALELRLMRLDAEFLALQHLVETLKDQVCDHSDILDDQDRQLAETSVELDVVDIRLESLEYQADDEPADMTRLGDGWETLDDRPCPICGEDDCPDWVEDVDDVGLKDILAVDGKGDDAEAPTPVTARRSMGSALYRLVDEWERRASHDADLASLTRSEVVELELWARIEAYRLCAEELRQAIK